MNQSDRKETINIIFHRQFHFCIRIAVKTGEKPQKQNKKTPQPQTAVPFWKNSWEEIEV